VKLVMKAESCSDGWSRKSLYTESAVELVLHICQRIWEPQPPGTLWPCPGLKLDCFTFFMSEDFLRNKTYNVRYHYEKEIVKEEGK
jgi:hypothetical protein